MKAIAIRHLAFEDLGLFAPQLKARGFDIDYIEVPTHGISLNDCLAADLLVILGGPIGVYEREDYPFLDGELEILKQRLHADRPTLGICLGAQLMASALGADVYPSGTKELGWSPINLTEAGATSPLQHLHRNNTEVLHWHGDTFDLPEGAVHLASTPVCRNQAFAIGRNGLALQFHAEAAGQDLERWFVGHTLEISQTAGVSVAALRDATARNADMCIHGAAFFNAWLDHINL